MGTVRCVILTKRAHAITTITLISLWSPIDPLTQKAKNDLRVFDLEGSSIDFILPALVQGRVVIDGWLRPTFILIFAARSSKSEIEALTKPTSRFLSD